MNKLLPLLALTPLAIGTPAMADISNQFNSLSQIQELCRTSPSRVFHTTDAGARYDQRIVVDGVVYDLGLVGGCYNEPLRIARLGEQVTWKDRLALGPALTSSRWRMVFWFSIDRTPMARFIVHLTLPNVAALKLMVLEGIEAFVLTQTSSSE